jgi:DNA-binding PadR family transcriptional regulator
MARAHANDLLLGEWACLGLLYNAPTHGFAIASRLKPDADMGRIWSLSRALTYRSLEQLTVRGLIEPIGEEPGIAGGNRTILTATRRGRAEFRRWVRSPVEHVRDMRSELLLKIALAADNDIDIGDMIEKQRTRIAEFIASLDDDGDTSDIVRLWRLESATAALRFLERCVRVHERGDVVP